MAEENLGKLIPYALAMAMGIAGVVLSILKGDLRTVAVLLGIGLSAIAITGLESSSGSAGKR